MLKKNIGPVDRALRLTLGIALLIAFFAMPEMAYRWALLIGIIPLVTALAGNCPLYSVFGFTTQKQG
ncbi:MAG: DUF2892 domain-containing protein [Pseudomonadota bacterium]